MERVKFAHFSTGDTSSTETHELHEELEKIARLSNQKIVEENVTSALLKIEEIFRQYYEEFANEMIAQCDYIANLLPLVQNYILLVATEPKCQYTEVDTIHDRTKLMKEYHYYNTAIRASNLKLEHAVDSLRIQYLIFKRYYAHLDKNVETAFIMGDAHHRPIAYFDELITDIFEYFHCGILKLNYHADLLDPLDYDAAEDYKNILAPSEEFEEYLMIGLTYCKCLQPKPKCPLPKVAPTKACMQRYLELPVMEQPRKKKRCVPMTEDSYIPPSQHTFLMEQSKNSFQFGQPDGAFCKGCPDSKEQ